KPITKPRKPPRRSRPPTGSGLSASRREGRAIMRLVVLQEPGQPLNQSFADHNLVDDFSLLVDQLFGVGGGRVALGRLIQQADAHQVALEFLLGEFLGWSGTLPTLIRALGLGAEGAP